MTRLLILISLILAACGDDSRSNDSTVNVSPTEIDRFINAYCALARQCCSKAAHPLDPLSDCETEVERQMDFVPAVRAASAVLQQPGFDECIAALDAAAGSCTAIPFGDDSCKDMLNGTAQKGDSCEDAIECQRNANPVVCLVREDPADPSATLGVCDEFEKAGAGEPCSEDADEQFYGVTIQSPPPNIVLTYCDRREGLFCQFPERVCEVLPGEGQACEYDCANGLYCDESDNTCKAALPEGTACDSHAQCANGLGCFGGTCTQGTIGDTKICSGDFN